jgi:phosphoribosylamine--glycine ligase/phosphoribosylformylglycinamidine cyclo-ligase
VKDLLEKEGETVYQVGVLKAKAEGEEDCIVSGLETWDA